VPRYGVSKCNSAWTGMPRRLSDRQHRLALAGRIKQARLAKGWGRERVAEVLEIAPGTIWKYEAGEIEVSLPMLRRLARVLSTDLGWLLGIETPNLREGEDEMLQAWRGLSEEERRVLAGLLNRVR
jgi:transcriptional regulator with XRE-family HTH domain